MSLFTPRKRTDFIVVHTTATPEGRDLRAKDIDRMHRQLGWNGIGYHYIIDLDGTVELGRPKDAVGSHVANYNSNSVALSYIGGVTAEGKAKDTRTPDQHTAMVRLVAGLMEEYPNALLLGHRDFPNVRKDCPCFDTRSWWRKAGPVALRERVAPLMKGSLFNPKGA